MVALKTEDIMAQQKRLGLEIHELHDAHDASKLGGC